MKKNVFLELIKLLIRIISITILLVICSPLLIVAFIGDVIDWAFSRGRYGLEPKPNFLDTLTNKHALVKAILSGETEFIGKTIDGKQIKLSIKR